MTTAEEADAFAASRVKSLPRGVEHYGLLAV